MLGKTSELPREQHVALSSQFYSSHPELLSAIRKRDRSENKGGPTGRVVSGFFFP